MLLARLVGGEGVWYPLRVMRQGGRKPQTTVSADAGRDETHSPDGVDLTLLRWMLSKTPTERLMMLQDFLRSLKRIRGG